MLVSIAMLILLLSIINYINYSISKHKGRLKSFSIRRINGASFSDLFIYDLYESMLCTISAILMALVLVQLCLPMSQVLLGKEFALDILLMPFPLIAFLSLVVFVIILNTLIPLWSIIHFDVLEYLKGNSGSQKEFASHILSSLQIGIGVLVLVFLLFINKQIHYVKHAGLGVDTENVICLYPIPKGKASPIVLRTEMDKLPFVKLSTLSSIYPLRWAADSWSYDFSSGKKVRVLQRLINADCNFLEVYGLNLQDGRSLRKGDEGKAAVVNEKWVSDYEWDSYEGKTVGYGNPPSVVGVMKDFHFESFHKEIDILEIVCRKMNGTEERVDANSISIRMHPGLLSDHLDELKELWESIYPEREMRFSFENDHLQALYKEDERLSKGISIFSFIAFILVMLGILGQVYQLCLNKTTEIGIRKINGASLWDILKFINYRFIMRAVIACILVIPIAYVLTTKWLENFAYKTPLSWWVFALAGLFTLLFVVGIVTLQAWKTANRNPVESLRHE